MRSEVLNFVHDVSTFRKLMKSVYASSADLQALNSEIEDLPKNCRIQVLPVSWRHLLDFPKKGVRENRHQQEHDVSEALKEEQEDIYPSLEAITVEGIPFVRSLITDLALDILLYQSPIYREHISKICLEESNRIYHLFLQRNPSFKGKVSLLGHSLGSAIYFDLLCRQGKVSSTLQSHSNSRSSLLEMTDHTELRFDFEVENFFALGSPIGLFQMLKGRTIAANSGEAAGQSVFTSPFSVSSPKLAQLYNIIHPTDPVCYRLEPLISPAMSSMKPQPLPYTKKGIFGTKMNEGITQIGAKVGGLWSSLSSTIGSSLLSRSLGANVEDVERMQQTSSARKSKESPRSPGAGTNITSGDVASDEPTLERTVTSEKMKQLAENTVAADRDGNANAPTLIDDELETLFAGFQKSRKSQLEDAKQDWAETEEKGKTLRREEMKVRALNRNGRVDYSIQESMLGASPLSTLVSHLSYWGDEDVSHFIQSQVLSRHRGSSPVNKDKS